MTHPHRRLRQLTLACATGLAPLIAPTAQAAPDTSILEVRLSSPVQARVTYIEPVHGAGNPLACNDDVLAVADWQSIAEEGAQLGLVVDYRAEPVGDDCLLTLDIDGIDPTGQTGVGVVEVKDSTVTVHNLFDVESLEVTEGLACAGPGLQPWG